MRYPQTFPPSVSPTPCQCNRTIPYQVRRYPAARNLIRGRPSISVRQQTGNRNEWPLSGRLTLPGNGEDSEPAQAAPNHRVQIARPAYRPRPEFPKQMALFTKRSTPDDYIKRISNAMHEVEDLRDLLDATPKAKDKADWDANREYAHGHLSEAWSSLGAALNGLILSQRRPTRDEQVDATVEMQRKHPGALRAEVKRWRMPWCWRRRASVKLFGRLLRVGKIDHHFPVGSYQRHILTQNRPPSGMGFESPLSHQIISPHRQTPARSSGTD